MVAYSSAQIPVATCVIIPWDSCINGTSPTLTCMNNSVHGVTVSTSFIGGGGMSNVTMQSSQAQSPWVGVTPTCASTGGTALGMVNTLTTNNSTILMEFNFTGSPTTGSLAVPWMTDVPQNAAAVSRGGTIATFASGAWSVSADWLGAVIAIK